MRGGVLMPAESIEMPKLTIAALATDKGVPVEFLESLGLFETSRAVCIPYGKGNRPRTRGLNADGTKRVKWASPTKAPMRVYRVVGDQVDLIRELGWMLLVEGESDCWTAWCHNLPARGVPGATMAKTVLLDDIAGVERVCAVEESDAGGPKFISGLMGRFAELRQEYIELHGNDEGFPALFRVRLPEATNDLNELHLLHRADPEAFRGAVDAALADAEKLSVEALQVPDSANSANTATPEWSPPIPLRHFDPPSFPAHVLPDWVRDFVEAEAVATQTPPDLAGMLVLAAVAAGVARHVEVVIKDGWSEPLNVYVAVVLESGTRKSAVFRDVVAPISAEEARRIAAGRDDLIQAQEKKTLAEKRLTAKRTEAIKGDANDADVIALAEEVAALTVPASPRLLADDATAEALERLLADNGGRIAVFTAEGDLFDVMQGRYASSDVMNIGVFLRAHAGDPIRTDRIGRGRTFVERPSPTLAVAVQPDVIYGLAAKREFRGRGLTPRILFSLPESRVGRREIDPSSMPRAIRSTYEAHISALHGVSTVNDEDRPSIVKMNAKARAVLLDFASEIEPELPPGGLLGDVTEWGSKLVGATARIAAILHAADHANDRHWWKKPIPVGTVRRAIEIARYLIPHARAAFALMGTDLAVADAEYILRWISRQSDMAFAVRDLFEGTKGRFKKVKNLEPGLDLLEEHGYIRFRPPPEKKGPGRPPSPVFDVNPLSQNPQYSQNPGTASPVDRDEPTTGEITEEGAA
jgi:replicative DNA helicase